MPVTFELNHILIIDDQPLLGKCWQTRHNLAMLTLTPRQDGSVQIDSAEQHLINQGVTPTLARLFATRGVTDVRELDTSIKNLLPASDLMGLGEAVGLLDAAVDAGDNILIVGDFDCDGATSTALMMRVLGEMGAAVQFLVPDRFKFGYGLTPEIVDLGFKLYAPKLIVTVDNGISSHAGVARAHQKGAKVIITDHHLTSKPKPPADAVVNPNQLGCTFSSKALAGVGVAFYVLAVLAKHRKQAGKSSTQVTKHLDLVALGTVADVAVLDTNNRVLVANGLKQINTGVACQGIRAMLSVAGKLNGFGALKQPICAQDLGFILGPRINAAGRMDNMRIGIECLLANDPAEALKKAQTLERFNQERKRVEAGMREDALTMLASQDLDALAQHKKSIVLYESSWHQGVIGIVAGRLKERFYKPTIVFAPSETETIEHADCSQPADGYDKPVLVKGSARSIAGIHIRDAIEAVAERRPELISHFGGHAMAAGLTLDAKHIDAFSEAFETVVAAHHERVFSERIYTDGVLDAREFNLDFCLKLKHELPWGNGFAPPLFDGVFEVSHAKVLKEKHLKLYLKHPSQLGALEAIWFNFDKDKVADKAKLGSTGVDDNELNCNHIKKVHLLYELDDNEFNGAHTVQLLVRDMLVI